MNRTKTHLGYSLLATVLAGSVALAAPPVSRPSGPAPDVQVSSRAALPKPGTGNFVERLTRDLRSRGLEVSVGYPKLYTQADCAYTYPLLNSCYGNNPAAPYVMPIIKSWPDEYVDPAMVNAWGRTRPGYSGTYRLDPREAIVFFGRMPPPARYMGLQTWVATTGWVSEDAPWDTDAREAFVPFAGPLIQYLFATVPHNPRRVQSVSSIDNNINNVVMENASGVPWGTTRYFVITPDRLMDQKLRAVLEELGVTSEEIFTERIPATFQGSQVGPLGLDENAVDFMTFLRYAMPDDAQAANAWRKSLPLTVLRVREPPDSGRAPEPFGDFVAEAREAVDESSLGDELDSLVDAIVLRAESQGLKLEDDSGMIDILNMLGQFGPDCRAIGMNCLGDNQDASYFLFTPKPLDTGNVYAIVSTLATETGNATYVGLSVNDASLLKGVSNIPDTTLKGSADSYAGTVAEPEKFFVHFFARDCEPIEAVTSGACTTITTDMVPLAGDEKAPGDPVLHGKFSAAVRAYVKPGTVRGPDPAKQLPPRSLIFSYQ